MTKKSVNAVNVVRANVNPVANREKEKTMPKFYRQNKKRIDPRYFLNETMDSSARDKQMAFNARIFHDQLFKLNNKLSPDDPKKQALNALMDKVGNTITGRANGLSDDEYSELSTAMSPGQPLTKFKDTVMAMLSRSHSGIDSDGDGALDSEELRNLAQDLESTGRKEV